jgi:DME family drug/metabolite transporter
VLQRLPLGLGVTLLSTAPVMALLVAGAEGDHPRLGGVLASLLAVSGVALAVLI